MCCIANEHKPDFILLTETWCNDQISDAFLTVPGYELLPDLRVDREDTAGGRGGGILVYAKHGMQILSLDKTVIFDQYCKFSVNDITVYLIYRPPNGGQVSLDNLTRLLTGVESRVILIGDFNLPEVDWEAGTGAARSRTVLEAVEESMLAQMVECPTHIRGNILDLLLTNIPERVIDVEEVGRLGHSDHFMLMAKVSVTSATVQPDKVQADWARADWFGMRERLAAHDWRPELEARTTEEAWAYLKSEVLEAVRIHVPMKKRRNQNRPPWLSGAILRAIRRKKRLWARAKRGEAVEEYREEERRVRNLIRNAKRQFERRIADGAGKDGVAKRQFFAYVRQKTKTRPSIGPLKDATGKTVGGDMEMANIFNGFFSSVFTQEDVAMIPEPANLYQGAPLEFVSITTKKVKEKILKLKRGSAAGPDGIGPQILLELVDSIASPLATIMRKSLDESQVPRDWRSANVAPIFKKGAKNNPGNYRPVSLTSVCCRVMESMVKDDIVKHLEANSLIRGSQHGFTRGRSCTSNLLSFLELVTATVDKGQALDVVFLDFAKAFDKVPVQRLLKKLRAHGVSGRLYSWVAAWLTDRVQRVVLNGQASSWAAVLSGVPQGSVLGPLLFLLFINDLDLVTEMADITRKFADDTKVGQRIRGEDDRDRLQAALDGLVDWATQWGMAFNVQKCKVMHVGRGNPKYGYTMSGQLLAETEEERDLGIIMSRTLKPSNQCAKAAKTASMVLGQITRAFYYRDKTIFVKLYKQYVRPHLEFAVQAWSPWTVADREALERVQRKMVRQVAGLRSMDYEDRLKELGLTTLEERRHQADMHMVFKILRGFENIPPEEIFTLASTGVRQTRQNAGYLNLRPRPGRLEVRSNFFSSRVVDDWNSIPTGIKNLPSVNAFKNAYARHRDQPI